MNEELLSSILFVLITWLLYVIIQYIRTYTYWKKRGVPQITPIPFFGNTFSVTCGEEPLYHFHYKNYFKFKDHPFGGYYDFGRPVLLVRDPELINHILTKDFAYFQDRGFPYDEEKEPLTANLFNMGGPRWKNIRTKITPCFTTGKRKLMFEMLKNCMDDLKNIVRSNLRNDEDVEFKDILARFSTDIITESAFGIKAHTLKNPEAEFRQMGRSLIQPNSRIRPIFLQICPKLMQYFGVRFLSQEMNDFFQGFVKEAVEFRKTNHVNRNDFLNSMVQLMENQTKEESGRDITYASIAAECWFFFFAGFEASSSALSMTLYELARNPEIQRKVREEVDRVVEKYDGEITYDALQEMTYMEMVIYGNPTFNLNVISFSLLVTLSFCFTETIRLYPSLPFLIRSCTKTYKIPNSDTYIDKGVSVVIPVVGLHRDPVYYTDPEVYNPENFSEEVKNSRHHCTFLPFGEGPRICIASRFGMMQIKTGLATLIRNFEFTPSSKMITPLQLIPRLILTNCGSGVWLKCSERSFN
uniref:Cytochrome P450 6PV1 short isoform n=1 Tax=Maconellicoccus hirsutus TaxID=177089 RepID=A0AAT9UTG8_MACHI